MFSAPSRTAGVVLVALAIGLLSACTTYEVSEKQRRREQAYGALQGRLEWLVYHAPLRASVDPKAPYRDLLLTLRELRCVDEASFCPATP